MSPPNDQPFAAIALRLHIVKQRHIDICLRIQADEQRASRAVRPLSETMVEHGYLTKDQPDTWSTT